ncbi:hypothetical protein CDD83_2967 [Cordyceps sp. RAO-2017]|nr:hypothetical protein CDD83_2967 [Cordyceps sp. RAO-2017]
MVQLLICRRSELDDQDVFARTALHYAADCGAVECLRLLLEVGADAAVEDDRGDTPLYLAARARCGRGVRALLAAGAPFTLSSRPPLLLELALTTFSRDVFLCIVESLTDGPGLHLSSDALFGFLQDESCDTYKLSILLQKGLDRNQVIGDYGCMLHYAALWGRLELVKLLCESAGSDVVDRIISENYGTPLQVAAAVGNLEIVESLLNCGASVRKGSGFYGSPIHAAAAMPLRDDGEDDEDREKKLEAYKGIVDAILRHDSTTLHLQAGYHGTPLQFAVYGAPFEMARDGQGRLPLHLAAAAGRFPMMRRRLVGDEVRMNSPDTHQGLHALHFAAGSGRPNVVKKLLELYPDAVRDRDVDGWTPLHWACRSSSLPVVQALLDAPEPADPNATSLRGWTPFDVALYHGGRLTGDAGLRRRLAPAEQQPFQVLGGVAVDEEGPRPTTPREALQLRSGIFLECIACNCAIFGPVYECATCFQIYMCFKCFRRVTKMHPRGHVFSKMTSPEDRSIKIDPGAAYAGADNCAVRAVRGESAGGPVCKCRITL